jgi:hypothetical protein
MGERHSPNFLLWSSFMGTIQTALQDVGYKPTKPKQPKPTIAALLDGAIDQVTRPCRRTIAAELQKLWDHNLEFMPSRKIQVQRAGSHYRVRYEGERDSCFVEEPHHAAKRLKVFDTLRVGKKYEIG